MKLKKWIAASLSTLLIGTILAGCGSNSSNANTGSDVAQTDVNSKNEKGADGKYTIGILQHTQHIALDNAREGFIDELAKNGLVENENLTIDYQNAQNDTANDGTIANKLVNQQEDLILAIATPAAIAVADKVRGTDIPVLFTCVTDPVGAKLVESNEVPGGNVTGTSDINPVDKQIDLIKQVVPDAKKLGILYSSSESNSKVQADEAETAAKDAGLETQIFTVTSSAEVQQVANSMVGKVDAVYVPTDNTIAENMPAVSTICNSAKIPIFPSESGMVNNGALAAYSLNYYDLGVKTAQMAIKILKDNEKPASMPVETMDTFDLEVNKTTLEELGLTLPESLASTAKYVETNTASEK